MTDTALIFSEILIERGRQEHLRASGKFKETCASASMPASEKYVVLGEEVGEIAQAILHDDTANLREELIQVAAVCVAWLESL